MNSPENSYIEWKDWDDASFGKFSNPQALYFAAETSIDSKEPTRVLEIGFGNGAFLGWVKSLGGEIFGVETNSELTARATDFFRDDHFFESLQDPRLAKFEGSFTRIVAFDVLEHISAEHLPEVLIRTRNLLAKDGKLIVRFPNGDSPFGRITQHGDPTHVTTLGRHKLEYFARNAGLTVAEIRAPALPVGGLDIVRSSRRRLVKLGRYFFERLISLLYFGGQRIPLDPNYLAVLVRATADRSS
jgi:SAM-dependent methyltransferase